jgi:protocatechuate 3,4-dioxygenase, beta subunit
MTKNLDRRNFLRASLTVSAGALAASGLVPKAFAASCGLTPPQMEGPFHPGEANMKPATDLTVVPGRPQRALGQVIYLTGRVVDQNCQPVAGANVEIWQACASGRYNHGRDPNQAPLDPNFRYWGETDTDADGKYMFKTIIPGAYPADPSIGWDRPPHIHVKVSRLGYKELTTQMYFKGNELNEKDLILREDVPRDHWDRVIVDFQPSGAGFEPGSLRGFFEISLQKVRG